MNEVLDPEIVEDDEVRFVQVILMNILGKQILKKI